MICTQCGTEYRDDARFCPACGTPAPAPEDPAEMADEAGVDVEADVTLSTVAAYDISLESEGQEYQPDEERPLTVSIANDAISEGGSYEVWHVLDDGTVEVISDVTVTDGSISFEATGFSVYMVVSSVSQVVTPQHTYTFHVKDGDLYKEYPFTDENGNTVYSQTIKDGSELIVPQLSSTGDEVFAGWYEGSRTGGTLTLQPEPYDFDDISITENRAIDLYAVYKEYVKVVFHDQYDSNAGLFPVAYTRRAELVPTGEGDSSVSQAVVRIDDLTAAYTGSNNTQMAFLGWSYTGVTTPGVYKDAEHTSYVITPDENGCITVAGETHLYPIYRNVCWLTYYAAQSGLSAAYVPPASYFTGDPVGTSLPVTSREGYRFLGWWTGTLTKSGDTETVNYGTQITDGNGSLVATADDGGVYISNGSLYLHSNATLYAKWEATYNIVYWKQTTDSYGKGNKTYEYAETVTRTADIGDTVSVADEDKAANKYSGYTFGHCNPASAVIGNTKAITVLNVYYDLDGEYTPTGGSYTLTFADSVTGEDASTMPSAVTGLSYGYELAD